MASKQPLILGIDPGTQYCAFALVSPSTLVSSQLLRQPTLHDIYQSLSDLYQRYSYDLIAVERPFLGKNVQSAFRLGEIVGIIKFFAQKHQLTFVEITPSQIKKAITGNGRASKEKVLRWLQAQDWLHTIPDHLDVSDAIAVALTALRKHYLTVRR